MAEDSATNFGVWIFVLLALALLVWFIRIIYGL